VRRLGRLIFASWLGVSLLLFVPACALWVRAIWVADQVTHWHGPTRTWLWMKDRDGVEVTNFSDGLLVHALDANFVLVGPKPILPTGDWRYRKIPAADVRRVVGPQAWHSKYCPSLLRIRDGDRGDEGGWDLLVPHYSLAGITAILPSVALVRWARRRVRGRRGRCVSCGYDLRASPSGARSAGRPLRLPVPPLHSPAATTGEQVRTGRADVPT
jgi:hypothetical protein